MKFSLIFFLALATAIRAAVAGNSRTRTRLSGEGGHATGMVDAVISKHKKTHGVAPELEAMILNDGSGGQDTNSYYEEFVPTNLVIERTKKKVGRKDNDGYVFIQTPDIGARETLQKAADINCSSAISIHSQPPDHRVVTIISTIVATRSITATAPFTATSTVSICTSQEHPPWIPSPIHSTGTASVNPVPDGPPGVTDTATLTIHTSLPAGTATISGIPSSNPISTASANPAGTTIFPIPSFATAAITSGTPEASIGTATTDPAPPKPSSSNATFTGSYPTSMPGHEVGTASLYPIPASDLTMIYPTVIPPTTLVTRVRNPTAIS